MWDKKQQNVMKLNKNRENNNKEGGVTRQLSKIERKKGICRCRKEQQITNK